MLLVFVVASGPGGDVADARKRPRSTTTTTRKKKNKPTTTTTATTTTTTSTSTTTTTTTTIADGLPTSFDVPTDIAGDCSADVTSPLLAWIGSVPDNSVLNFADGACYEIEGTLYVAGRRSLTFDGHGATFMAKTDGSGAPPPEGIRASNWPRRRAHWWFSGSNGITIRDLTVIGANPYTGRSDAQYDPLLEVQSGVVVTASNNVTIDGLTISKVWGDFVTIEQASTGVTVRNSTMTTSGRQGIAVTSGRHIVIDGNHLDDVRWGVFDLEPNGAAAVIDDVKILHNVSGRSRWFWLANVGPSPFISNIDVEYNTITVHSPSIVYVSNKTPSAGLRGPWTIAHNDFHIYWTGYAAFELAGAKDVSIYDNVVHPVPAVNLVVVRASSSDRIAIHDNDFTGSGQIFVQGDTPTWCEANNLPTDRSHNKPC